MPNFLPLALFLFSGKSTRGRGGGGGGLYCGSFRIQKGVWPYGHAHDVPLVTLIIYIVGNQLSDPVGTRAV